MMKIRVWFILLFGFTCVGAAIAEQSEELTAKIDSIIQRPDFRHALFGIKIYSLTHQKVLYEKNADKLFIPGSVTKIVTAAATLNLLGPDYRFRTRVYRTGPVSDDGELQGDLVLVASGDPNLSNRVQPDETLAFENDDHAYGMTMEAKLVAGDPLQIIRALAKQVKDSGIKKISGHVLVDVTMFPEGTKEGGSGVVISPIAINDNVIDVIITPGDAIGQIAALQPHPKTKYASFQCEVKTAANGESDISFSSEKNPDGTLRVKVQGTVMLGSSPRPYPFIVPQPSRFAETVFTEALQKEFIRIEAPPSAAPGWKTLSASYKPENQVAEHISPPLKEDVKVTLKVSQNLHASMMPYLLGSILAKEQENALEAGFKQERAFLKQAKLEISAAVQSDGAGGQAYFTPDFIVQLLKYMTEQKSFGVFYEALPVLGKDGTLAHSFQNSPFAGKLRAKTGTSVAGDLLNFRYVVNGKGLAGYLDTADGERIIVAIFANHLPITADFNAVLHVGDALVEIAAAAYED